MTDLIALYRIAEANGIKVRAFDLDGDEAVSFKRKGKDIIVIDPLLNPVDQSDDQK